mmetsp:Transcript_24668/g.38067  ORF Transcript_24668/g.38067 Transcript_24668/m.38067 type:complete len:106 (+) Transcript_24668:294-611(+)
MDAVRNVIPKVCVLSVVCVAWLTRLYVFDINSFLNLFWNQKMRSCVKHASHPDTALKIVPKEKEKRSNRIVQVQENIFGSEVLKIVPKERKTFKPKELFKSRICV